MTIHLMENGEHGDIRVRNGLSRKIDINPYSNGTRSQFIKWIVKTMFLEGEGNAVVYPVTSSGYIDDLRPVPASFVSFIPEGLWDYKIAIAGPGIRPGQSAAFCPEPGFILSVERQGLYGDDIRCGK